MEESAVVVQRLASVEKAVKIGLLGQETNQLFRRDVFGSFAENGDLSGSRAEQRQSEYRLTHEGRGA